MVKKKLRSFGLFGVVGIVALTFVSSLLTATILKTTPAHAEEVLTGVAADYGINVNTGTGAINVAKDEYILTWVDAGHLELKFKSKPTIVVTFIPKNSLREQRDASGGVEYTIRGWPCDSKATSDQRLAGVISKMTIDIDFKSSPAGECINTNPNNYELSLGNADPASNTFFKWMDAGRIDYVDDANPLSFVQLDPVNYPNIFALSSEQGADCQDKLLVSNDKTTLKYYELAQDFNGDTPTLIKNLSTKGCGFRQPNATQTLQPLSDKDLNLADPVVNGKKNSTLTAGSSGTAPVGGTAAGDVNVDCDASGFNLSWVLCPIIDGSLNGAQTIFKNFVEPMLREQPISTDVSGSNPIMDTWKAFRNIGNIVLVFALLIVVFGQSIGGGIVDAYTAKKTMPRILIAAILLNLSIYLCAILVDIFNVLGQGMARLIIAPLKDGGNLKIQPDGKAADAGGITVIFAAVLAAVAGTAIWRAIKIGPGTPDAQGGGALAGAGQALLSVMPYILLFIILPIFLAIMSVMITLIVRKAIILILVIASPVAMALFAIPSADKYAKKWLDAFIKTLMVYPIITAIFGVSQVLAVLTFNSGNSGSITILLATLIIAFAPLFMIPFAFKLAGGVIGGVANAVRSGRDNLKKAWGDDKHNPHSLRSRMGQTSRGRASERMFQGAAAMDQRLISRIGRVSSKARSAADAGAARTASEPFRGDPEATAAAEGAATRIIRSNLGGTNRAETLDSATRIGRQAGTLAQQYGGDSGEAAGIAMLAAAQNPELRNTDGSLNYDRINAAGEAAAHARANGVQDVSELSAIGTAAAFNQPEAAAALAAGAPPLTQPQRLLQIDAIRASYRDARSLRRGRARTTEMVGLAARSSEAVIRAGGDRAAASAAGTATVRAVDEVIEPITNPDGTVDPAHDRPTIITDVQSQVERIAVEGQTNPDYNDADVQAAAGRAAGRAHVSGRVGANPGGNVAERAADAAAFTRSTTAVNGDAAADAAGDAIT